MKQKLKTQLVYSPQQVNAFKLRPVAIGCAAMLFGMGGAAHAQVAAPVAPVVAQAAPASADTAPAIQSVTVVGIRRGIEDAISAKRNSDMIVETISSEDLGKLPDDSIADALSSLPGVAAQIIGGRAATLNIRGLSGDFVNTTFNGREQASVGDNRAVMFDQYPAELISAATVYKTPDAELIGQGLAATVDLKTLLPLDFTKRVVQFKVMGEKASYGNLNPEVNSKGDRISASYIDQFADRTIGVAFGIAHLDSPVEDKQTHSWGFGNNAPPPGHPNSTAMTGAEWWANSTASVRDGMMGVIEWKPNHNFTSVIDTYYSRSTTNDTFRGLQSGLSYESVANPTFDQNGFLTGGSGAMLGGPGAYSAGPVVRNDMNSEVDHIFSIGWKNTWKLDDWTLVADLSGSHASSRQSILELYSGPFAPVSGNFTATPGNGMVFTNPSVDFTNPNSVKLGDPGGWGQDGYDKFPQVTDGIKEFRLSATRELDNDLFSSVSFGGNITARDKTRVAPEYFVDFANQAKTTPMAVPSNLIVGPIALQHGPSILGLNIPGLMGSGTYKLVANNNNGDIYAKDWSVDEKVSTFYTQLNINTMVGSIPVRGNFGVQYIHSNQSSTAIADNKSGLAVPNSISGGASYNNALPSLNLIASFPHDQELRLGIAEELQRPRFDDMTASNEASLNSTTLMWSSSAGNPALKPTLADGLDVAYTKYLGKEGYISVAPYYKYLKTYIYTEAQPYNFSGLQTNGVTPISNIGEATQPVNGTGGNMKGIELTVSMPLDMLTPVLTGFGVVANSSWGKSKIKTNFNGDVKSSDLPGFSSTIANLVLYYTNGGFELRYRESYRSTYLGEVQGFGANLAYANFLGVHSESLQASYEFKSGPAKGLTGLFQVLNLNNPTITQTQTYANGSMSGLSQSDTYGRTYLVGINYKM